MEIDLKELIIKVLKESRDSLSPFQIFNSLVMKDHNHHSIRDHVEIEDIRLICKLLAHDGILIEKEPGKYAFVLTNETAKTIVESMPATLQSVEVNHHHPGIKKINRQKKTGFLDLYLGIILIILSILFILIPPYNETLLRIIFALPFLLFLPGYFFITSMFPKKGELSPIERFTLSIGLSIAIFVFDGFALNYTPWGCRPNSIVYSLSLIDGIFLLIAIFQRIRLKENAYDFSFENVTSFYRTLISKEQETGPEYDPALEKMLIKTMVIAILIVS